MVDFQAMTTIGAAHVVTEAEWNQMVRNVNALGAGRQIETLTRGATTYGSSNGLWTSLFTDPQNIALIPRVSARVLAILTVNINSDSMHFWSETYFTLKLNADVLTDLQVRWSAAHGNVGGTVTHSASAVVLAILTLPTVDGVNYLQGQYKTSTDPAHQFKTHNARLLVKEL
jgi:hypothetical protein